MRFPTVSFLRRTKQPPQHNKGPRPAEYAEWNMVCSSVGLSFADVLWAFFALFFLVALCVHKISQQLPRKYETCRLYVLFQDLIRYGQTKQNLKRDDWLRVFDLPKR